MQIKASPHSKPTNHNQTRENLNQAKSNIMIEKYILCKTYGQY